MARPVKDPKNIPTITVSVEEYEALKTRAPDQYAWIDRACAAASALVQTGFLTPQSPTLESFFYAAVSEITLLRQERTPIAANVQTESLVTGAFCLMWQRLSEILTDQKINGNQARYMAFSHAINSITPALCAQARAGAFEDAMNAINAMGAMGADEGSFAMAREAILMATRGEKPHAPPSQPRTDLSKLN